MPVCATVKEDVERASERSALITVTVVVTPPAPVPVPVSPLDEVTFATPLRTVCPGVPTTTCTVTVMLALLPAARFPVSVQVIVPVPPTVGVVQFQPAGAVKERKVVLFGVVCVITGLVMAGRTMLLFVS